MFRAANGPAAAAFADEPSHNTVVSGVPSVNYLTLGDEERVTRGNARSTRVVGRCPLMCRFSDAGSEEVSTYSGGRRLKSAEARNRGK